MSAADRDTDQSSSYSSSSLPEYEMRHHTRDAVTPGENGAVVVVVNPRPWPEDDDADAPAVIDADEATTPRNSEGSSRHRRRRHRSTPLQFFRNQRNSLLYSYMGPILRRGAELHRLRKDATSDAAGDLDPSGSGKKKRLQSRRWLTQSSSPEPEPDEESDKGDNGAGDARELSSEDVYAVPAAMRAQRLADVFWSTQRQEQQRQRKQRSTSKKSSNPTVSFLRILWVLSRPTYLPAALWQFLVVVCQCSLPLLVRQVLLRLEANPSEPFRREGLPLALAMFAVSLVEGVGNERHKFLSFRTGITLRAAVVSAAHGHVLRMTPRGRTGLTSGEIQNLVAVDAQKLFELAQEGHYSWSCPLAMVIVSVLLLLELGVSALVGIATMFLIVPFVQCVVREMMSIRKRRVGAADRRVEGTSAMLQGIRFAKLNRYEEKFIDRVLGMRRMEVSMLRRELFFLALTIFATVVSPVIASGFTFITYVRVSEDNILTPSMTFTSLFLFAALRFPINYAGKFMGKAAQGFQACHRFSLFFARDSLDDWVDARSDGLASRDGGGTAVVGATNNNSAPGGSSSDGVSALEAGEGSAFNVKPAPMEGGGCNNTCTGNIQEGATVSMSTINDTSPPLIDVKANFSVGTPGSTSSFTLSDIDLRVHRSEIMCVVGPVASGKSTLVQGLIGELIPLPNRQGDFRCKVDGRISYAAQVPFILNATVRDNILFGTPYDAERYGRVLEACCLNSDLMTFHYGDMTEIGERGVTLSGGQKQRLSLARVAYSMPDVAILDDPLSALDAGTGRMVFEKLFRPSGGDGLFANTAVVLVTHASHILNQVDSMMVLVNGNSAFVGSWGELVDCQPSDPNEADAIESIRTSVQEDHSDEGGGEQHSSAAEFSPAQVVPAVKDERKALVDHSVKVTDKSSNSGDDDDSEDGKIMSVEERKYGLSQLSTWLAWFSHAGGPFFFFIIVIAMALDRFMYVATEWWLAIWTRGAFEPVYQLGKGYAAQTSGMEAQMAYIETYLWILLISCTTTLLRVNWIVQGGARCASRLFVSMLKRVLYAPMSYFDTTPVGRIMNRFTYDTETLDVTLVMNMTMLMTSLGWIFTGIILQSIILPWQLLVVFFIVVVYWVLLLHYRKSAVDLQRLDATSRSPVQAQLAEAIDGTSTMRVFGKTSYFSNVFRKSLDENSAMMMNFMAAHRWLSVRIQMLGACAVLFSVAFVASFNDILNLDPGIAAILIIWSANFTISLSFFVQGVSESEASMTSLERVLAMTDIPQEEDASRVPEPVDPSWPSSGDLTFDNVDLRYRPGLPLSLDGLTFTLKSGQRCGVVGRTGAGKSTLAAALFRLVELESGSILLDGVDVSKISLSNVRGRPNGMTIIPQEPVLLPGTLKQCLDPFGDYTDKEVAEALLSVRGASRGLSDINESVEEGGRNFSVGERQLICLGRAMLAKPKLLFLDEATASVDGETDSHIQRMLRSRFVDTTLLTIAHRLNTIMDYDVILVVDKGKAAEFGTPAELLAIENSIFSQLVESTGKESSVALRSMVFDT